MATDDETREAADGTEVQAEAVDLGMVHFEPHPEVKLPSIMEIKNMGETIDSTEGTLKIPEDQVLVEAPSELELPPEHKLNGKASSLNGHMGKDEKISSAQLHENGQEEAELDETSAHQSNGINKEEVIDGLSHGESTTEDSGLLKHEKDEEPRDDKQDSEGVTVDDDLVLEDTLKTDNSVEQTDDGQKDQNQEPEKANDDTQPVSIANIANVEEADVHTGFQTPVEPHMDDSGAVPVTIDEKIEMEEPAKADDVVRPDHKESFPEETSIAGPTEEVVKVEDQQSQRSYTMDADVVQEEMLKCEVTHAQEELPKSEAHEPMTNAQEMLNKESAEGIDAMNENNEETAHQSNMEAPKETSPELDSTTGEPPVNVQVENHEQSEEIEHAEAVDTEAEMQQRTVDFEDAILENQHNLGVTIDNDTVQEDTLKPIEQKDDGQQDQDLEPEKATEDTQPASMTNSSDVEVVAEAPSRVQTSVEPSMDNSDTIPDTIDGNKETDEPAKADGVHPDHKESSPEDASIAEPTEEVAKMEDPQSQQADAVDADVVHEEVHKFEHADEPETNAHEVLNQESTEETDGPVNEKTEETVHQSNMAVPEETTPENDTITGEPHVNIQVQNQESVEKIKDAEEVDTGPGMQQSSVAFDEVGLEDQHNVGVTMDDDTVQQDTLEATEQTKDPQGQDLEPEKANENTQPATMTNIPDVEVVSEEPSGVQTPVEINLDNSDAIPNTADTNTETDESAKAEDTTEISEPQMTETEEEPKDIEATEAQEITAHRHVTPSKELSAEDDSAADETHKDDTQQTLGKDSVEVKEAVLPSEDTVLDNVTAEEPTCDSQEVDNAESTEETKGNTAENIKEVSDAVIVDEAVKEQDVLQTEDIAETHMRELEPEKTKNTEPVQSEEASDQRNAVLFNDLAQEDTPESEIQQTESATETTETEAAPQARKDCVSEEPSLEDHMIESEIDCDTKGVSITESLEVIDGDKDIITGGISGQSNMVSSGESAQENDVAESKPTDDIQPVQELEPEEIKNTEFTEMKETSHEMNPTVFQTPTEEDNPATIDLHESARELSNIEATEDGTPHQSDAAQSEEQAPEGISSEPQLLEPESVEEMSGTTATETTDISKGELISSSGESVPEEIATEDNTSTELDVDHQQVQDQESTDFMETEADKPPGIASSCILSTPEQSTSEDNATAIAEDNATAMEPNSDTQAENLQPTEVTEGTENVKSNTAFAEAVAPEENVETGVTADMPSVQEPELEETKDAEPAGTEDIMTSSDPPAEKMDMETMGTEAVPHESHVESTNELSEDVTEPVLNLESFEEKKCTDTIEDPEEPLGSTSDETTPTEENTTVTERTFDTQQVQNLTSQEIKDSEDAKPDELSDLSCFPTEEADQESNLPRTEPATDVLQVQELGSTEETRDIESEGTEHHQQHGVSTFEEPAVDSEPNVDDQQVHEDKVPEVKDNEAMEAEEVIQQSNIDIPDYATEEKSKPTSDLDSYVQPAQHVDSENNQLEKAEETAGTVAIEETPTEDSIVSEINPPVDIKQEHELEPVEEIKGTDANEAEEELHTTQVDAIEKSASEGNMASIEPTSDIKQENKLEATKEINGIEAVNDGEQAENATSEDPSPTDNETTLEGHSTELNEEIMGNETDNVKDEIQTSVELKDGACDLGEAVLPTQGSENMTPKDEEIENKKEEIQADEQKHEDDFTMEPLVEPKDIENGTKNRTEDTDVCEVEQTEALITEILKHEEAPHVSEESTPSSTDMEVGNVKGTDEGTETDAGAKNDNKDDKESAETDDIIAKDSTAEHDETIYEIPNEEVEPGLASSGQEAAEPAPSNDAILENDPAAVTQNVESGEHTEDKECTDKVNDDAHTIQASSEEEIAGETNENREIQNEDNAIHHDESQTKSEKDEAPQLHANEPCNMNAKIDDTTTPGAETIDGNPSIKPREVKEIGENKGLDSTSEPFVESSIQNNVEQDLSRHHKVEDENLSMMEQNDVDIEAMQEKADESASDINLTKQCQEEISEDNGQQLVEEKSFGKIDEAVSHEKTESSTTEVVTVNDTITNKASRDDGGPSDESLKTFNDTRRDLDVSSVITASKEESVNENIEDHKLEKTEREMPSSDKLLPTEPEENQLPNEINEELQDENQITSEKNEEDTQDTETGDAQNDVEQDLPVSNFLMKLILGKKNGVADENSEPEAEGKQGETTEDDSCMLISKEEESVGSLCTENKVDDNLTFEQEKHDVKCSEETHEMVKEQSDDLKMDIERSIHTDEESSKNTQGNPQDKISDELLSEEAASVSTNMKARDIEISNFELDDKKVYTVCQENMEDSTKNENGSLKSNINDLTKSEASEEGTLGEQQTGHLHESLPEDNSAGAVSTSLLIEPGVVDAIDSSYDAEAAQNLTCAKEDDPTESSIIEATSSPHIQMECEEVEKKEENKHASKGTENVPEEAVESSNDNPQKSTSSEVTPDEQAPHIVEPVSDTQKISVPEKEICEGLTCMDEKENSNFSTEGVENFQTVVEIQADGANMQINQDKKDEVADDKTAMGPEKLEECDQQQQETDRKHEVADDKTAMGPEKLGESDFQEHKETDTEQKSPKVSDEGDQQFLVKKETMIKEQVVPETVESDEQTMSNEKQELFDSKVQERDLNVVSPREASGAEENFVDVTKPEFSTDEEQSPKADANEKIYDEKIKVVEGTKDFTDEAATKTEAPGATQKATKKLKLLSGVGSKVKHQLAKVKKAIVGKPGNTKPDSPKS